MSAVFRVAAIATLVSLLLPPCAFSQQDTLKPKEPAKDSLPAAHEPDSEPSSTPVHGDSGKVPDTPDDNGPFARFGTLLNYNTEGGHGLAKLVPEVFLGFQATMKSGTGYEFGIRGGPSVSTSSISIDTTQQLRALMLPGNVNIDLFGYGILGAGRTRFLFALGVGSKVIAGASDSSPTFWQHSIRSGIGIQLEKLLSLSAVYTFAWHNITNESDSTFKAVFGVDRTSVEYLTVSASFYVPSADIFLFVGWRRFESIDRFPGFGNQSKVLSIGLRKDFDVVGQVGGSRDLGIRDRSSRRRNTLMPQLP